ncbi:hypothetical protein M8J77_007256 [Diaphorina citri]|nr:hypothetical protein M8J77_007256 [Diaphorina citri]
MDKVIGNVAFSKPTRMAEVNTDYVHRNNSQLLKKHMEAMLNNKSCSDTTFLVNKTQFYAWSHLVGMASKQLGMLLTTHYEEYGNRNIYIENVKSNESFLVILKYIYGVEINFTRTNVSHLCEVLSLAQTYELTEFYADIKYYLSTLNCFQLDMVVVLLNTSKQFDLLDLYKRLTMFVYQNADQLVKHTSFVELKFDVLMDLLKSDWFCASEIDILSGVINWQDNMSTRESNDEKTNDIEKQEFSGDNTSDVSCSGTDLSKLSLDDESEDEDDNLRSEKSDWEDSKELSYSEKNMDTGNIDPAETDRKEHSKLILHTLNLVEHSKLILHTLNLVEHSKLIFPTLNLVEHSKMILPNPEVQLKK